jgi:acetyl esterase/lipase
MKAGKLAPPMSQMVLNDKSPGSGPYPSNYTVDASLPNHTIYSPRSPPKDVKLGVIVWGNGGCVSDATVAQNLLREIASQGFIVLANGLPNGGGQQTKMKSMRDSLAWMEKGGAGSKFGQIDPSKVASMGHSCGGLESYAASYHDNRIKNTILINSAVLDDSQRYLLAELKAPVALFIGGPNDVAYDSVSFTSHSNI